MKQVIGLGGLGLRFGEDDTPGEETPLHKPISWQYYTENVCLSIHFLFYAILSNTFFDVPQEFGMWPQPIVCAFWA